MVVCFLFPSAKAQVGSQTHHPGKKISSARSATKSKEPPKALNNAFATGTIHRIKMVVRMAAASSAQQQVT
jgi:hypothetical protein